MRITETLEPMITAITKIAESLWPAVPADLSRLDELKTAGYYDQALRRAVREFYRGEIDAFAFVDEMIRLITEQFTKAFREGMRNVKLDPDEDMIPEFQSALNEQISKELNNVLDFAGAIEAARNNNGDPALETFYSRVSMWVNRYAEMVHFAMVTCGANQKLEWILGPTERHCGTCSRLHGVVAFASQWLASGYRPQNAPNPLLECGGWRCQCRLQPTDKRRTRGGVPR